MGVKSLWSLLEPVGRPVLLETMEGKAMAIDSSIWIYQFQATMRDKEGRGLVNAHVLGFLRRISKLLFYGIKPVFVFDGGAPALKRSTIAERKKKKAGAVASHTKVAERLLAAQMRREALNHAHLKHPETSKGKSKAGPPPAVIDENTVYLEDLDDSIPKSPAKERRSENQQPTPPSASKSRWHDHDPYKLPELNLDEVVAKVTRGAAPDPRLATEEELRDFIEDMRPEDFDVSSPAFRELPTEVQYEIIGDLRLKSRQTSYKRLQNMLKNAPTPLDFSKEQIKNLKQRNSLTQQLLVTTDGIGKANVAIPIRIASERNREYIITKNEGAEGGWVLGIRDDGTQNKPIEIDIEKGNVSGDDETSDADMEEVPIPGHALDDPDLREYRRSVALSALANRYSPQKLAPPVTKKVNRKPRSKPLFRPDIDEEPQNLVIPEGLEDDPELLLAMQESLDLEEEANLRQALDASKAEMTSSANAGSPSMVASSSRSAMGQHGPTTPRPRLSTFASHIDMTTGIDSDDDDMYASPTRLEVALSIANTGPSHRPHRPAAIPSPSRGSMFGTLTFPLFNSNQPTQPETTASSDDDMEEVPIQQGVADDVLPSLYPASEVQEEAGHSELSPPQTHQDNAPYISSDEDMEDVLLSPTPPPQQSNIASGNTQIAQDSQGESDTATAVEANTLETSPPVEGIPPSNEFPTNISSTKEVGIVSPPEGSDSNLTSTVKASKSLKSVRISNDVPFVINAHLTPEKTTQSALEELASDSDDGSIRWSRSPSPSINASGLAETSTDKAPQEQESWDAAQEMDPQAEEGEFARFISQVKGKDLDSVRREIDDEIRALNQEKKAAMRDSDDITQQMISQIMIMLRLFGIPYITAPMEAEAQCSELLTLGLVDGIITDDSDVFLFGGLRVLKNMFNQSKTVECFLLSDLERELGLDRDKLIRLAYLLGSDYTDGLPGVGPVVAMELLSEFSGTDGLHKFREWWQKVQTGRDKTEDNQSKFRKRFKKKFKELYLPDDWPNPPVRDAYYHPTVDQSDEPFKWGMPDLDALRDFFHTELGWQQSKVDDLLLPIIRKMGKRGQTAALNRQGNLNGFFDVPLGGLQAPRKRQAYASKRLQQVISEYRKGQVQQKDAAADDVGAVDGEDGSSDFEDTAAARPAKRRKKAADKGEGTETKSGTRKAWTRKTTAKSQARGGRTKRGRGGRKMSERDSGSPAEDEAAVRETMGSPPPPLAVNLRPRPKPKPAWKGKAENGQDIEA